MVRLESAPNFRDLGGYIVCDGRRIRRGRIFRSDSLSMLTRRDLVILGEAKIGRLRDALLE